MDKVNVSPVHLLVALDSPPFASAACCSSAFPSSPRGSGAGNGSRTGSQDRNDSQVDIQERGEIFFFYRPKVEREAAHSADDVQRLYIVLRPESGERPVQEKQDPHKATVQGDHSSQEVNIEKQALLRLIVMGKKNLPDPTKRSVPYLGFAEMVTTNIDDVKSALKAEEYDTSTRGHRDTAVARACWERACTAQIQREESANASHIQAGIPSGRGEAGAPGVAERPQRRILPHPDQEPRAAPAPAAARQAQGGVPCPPAGAVRSAEVQPGRPAGPPEQRRVRVAADIGIGRHRGGAGDGARSRRRGRSLLFRSAQDVRGWMDALPRGTWVNLKIRSRDTVGPVTRGDNCGWVACYVYIWAPNEPIVLRQPKWP